MSVVILIPQARSLCREGNVGECPALDNTHTDRFGVHLELDELHGVLKDLLTRVEILDLDRVADRTPIVLDYHVLKCAEFHSEMLEQLTHSVLVLLERETDLSLRTGDIVVSVRLVERFAPFEPAVIAAVPVLETVEKSVLNCLFDVLLDGRGVGINKFFQN